MALVGREAGTGKLVPRSEFELYSRSGSVINGSLLLRGVNRAACPATSMGGETRCAATGTFTDDATAKTVSLPPTSARYVRLRALTEAGNRGPWTSAADIRVIGTT